MKIRYTITLEKEVTEFDGIKDLDERLNNIYRDMDNNINDYTDTDAKVIRINELLSEYDYGRWYDDILL